VRQRSHTWVIPRRKIRVRQLAKELPMELICGGNSMTYDILFYSDYAFPVPFALAMFPDRVWNKDWFENAVPITPARIYAN